MSSTTPVEKIRAVIANQLSNCGVRDVQTLREAILIRDGLFCGRKFQCEGFEVIWFIEEDQIKYFAPSGDLIKATSAAECILLYQDASLGNSTSERRAA
jgi:hypothetical protein